MDPIARSSAWRKDPSFPIYHNDNVSGREEIHAGLSLKSL